MACEASNASSFVDSAFDDSWLNPNQSQQDGLGANQEFNDNFNTDGNNTVDPQLTFSNLNTPDNRFNAAYDASVNGIAETLSPEPSAYGTYPTVDFGGQDHGSPFFQSIEPNQAPVYQPPPLRNHPFRRSVSEPPGGPEMPPQQQPPPITFHRDNHYLGKPKDSRPMPLKSLPKNKQQRRQPYPLKMDRGGYEQLRPEHRRAQTQPVRLYAPTSTPVPMPQQYMPQAMMYGRPHISARVCSPMPGVAMAQSPPQMIDPALSAPPTDSKKPQPGNHQAQNTVSISMTVGELRSMIFEAVRQAVSGPENKPSTSDKGCIAATSPADAVPSQETMPVQAENDQ
ncbi:Hypothetical predicted protein [Lecanosticta acicola]|uniref:Uncharacterized protein n=1 Tax=Lecanosticta acicola TaxID=111012 RepID=A0AAI8YS41_9PEZI|nr:Hypothetical predicted protein [Lecanosticta acicola]